MFCLVGSEWRYVIISTVCSLPPEAIESEPDGAWLSKHLGFVGNPNQINVGITRAKEGLCIIGEILLLIFFLNMLICSFITKFLSSQRKPKVAQLQCSLEKTPQPLQASGCSGRCRQDFSAWCSAR